LTSRERQHGLRIDDAAGSPDTMILKLLSKCGDFGEPGGHGWTGIVLQTCFLEIKGRETVRDNSEMAIVSSPRTMSLE
jgi:hypothetical protein